MLKDVFIVYDEAHIDRLRIWARSWRANGWTPRILTRRDLGDKPTARKVEQIIKAKGGGFLQSDSVINFSYVRGKSRPSPVRTYGKRGWETADLVRFPSDATEDLILNCGRKLLNAAARTI